MKELRKLFVIEVIVFWLVYILLIWLLYTVINRSLDFATIMFGLIFAALFACINVLTAYSLLKPKFNFLESNNTDVPDFGNKVVKVFGVERSDFSFEVVKYKIKEKYSVVLYDDVEQYIIKFYTGVSLFSWGLGGAVVYDPVDKTIVLSCFPMAAYTDKAAKSTQALADKMESLIVNK